MQLQVSIIKVAIINKNFVKVLTLLGTISILQYSKMFLFFQKGIFACVVWTTLFSFNLFIAKEGHILSSLHCCLFLVESSTKINASVLFRSEDSLFVLASIMHTSEAAGACRTEVSFSSLMGNP